MRQYTPEQPVEIPIPDSNLHMNAILRGNWDQPLIVMLHGLTGDNNTLLQYNGARYLSDQGYATLRVNLYDNDPKTRDLRDCTVQTHADDFDTAVSFSREQGAHTIGAVGHSYGGLTILHSTVQLDGAVLWDPSSKACSRAFDRQIEAAGNYLDVPEAGMRLFTSGPGHLCPLGMIEERKTPDDPGIARKAYPVSFMAAENSQLKQYVEAYATAAGDPHELRVIEGAGHSFNESDAVLDALLRSTKDWFDQCLQR